MLRAILTRIFMSQNLVGANSAEQEARNTITQKSQEPEEPIIMEKKPTTFFVDGVGFPNCKKHIGIVRLIVKTVNRHLKMRSLERIKNRSRKRKKRKQKSMKKPRRKGKKKPIR